jgi:hypothetical protein
MRVDRRVSPNQTALWTVYELVDAQAARLKPRAVPLRSGFRLLDIGLLLVGRLFACGPVAVSR